MMVYEKFIHYFVLLALLVMLAACGSPAPTPTAELLPTPTELLTNVATLTPPISWTDERAVMAGLCFESVFDAAGRVFVLRSADELAGLFDLADNSQLCRAPVARGAFDFADGRVLAGLWSRARGCDAAHEVIDVTRDDVARVFAVRLRLVASGECGYELVQPFWIGLSGVAEYDIRLLVE